MNDVLTTIVSFSVFIAGAIAALRFRQYDRAFDPFVFFVWLGCCNELLSNVLVRNGFHTTVNNNLYVLLAALLLVWFFQKMDLFRNSPALPYGLMLLYLAVWGAETFWLRSIHQISSYFRILISLATVLMSIHLVNRLLVQGIPLLKEGSFWICSGFIIHFTLKVLVEVFWLYGIMDADFQLKVFGIQVITNLITHLTYAWAALWISRKPPFSLQF